MSCFRNIYVFYKKKIVPYVLFICSNSIVQLLSASVNQLSSQEKFSVFFICQVKQSVFIFVRFKIHLQAMAELISNILENCPTKEGRQSQNHSHSTSLRITLKAHAVFPKVLQSINLYFHQQIFLLYYCECLANDGSHIFEVTMAIAQNSGKKLATLYLFKTKFIVTKYSHVKSSLLMKICYVNYMYLHLSTVYGTVKYMYIGQRGIIS